MRGVAEGVKFLATHDAILQAAMMSCDKKSDRSAHERLLDRFVRREETWYIESIEQSRLL